jgi:hypothetical protein
MFLYLSSSPKLHLPPKLKKNHYMIRQFIRSRGNKIASIIEYWKPVYNTGEYHAFLIYEDDSGNVFYARGGNTADINGGSADGSPELGYTSGPGFGDIATRYGSYEPGTPDYFQPSELQGLPSQLIRTGSDSDLSQTWNSILTTMDRIGAADLPYNPMYQNSNSVITTALKNAGIEPPINDPSANPVGYAAYSDLFDKYSMYGLNPPPGSGPPAPASSNDLTSQLISSPYGNLSGVLPALRTYAARAGSDRGRRRWATW